MHPAALSILANEAMKDVSFLLRPAHNVAEKVHQDDVDIPLEDAELFEHIKS